MEQKLTIQDICKYPNSRVVWGKESFRVIRLLLENTEVIGISNDYDFRISSVTNWVRTYDCKLELRTIKDMTDEERSIMYCINTKEAGMPCLKYIEITDYLRSISVDIDNFISQGKAVRETK